MATSNLIELDLAEVAHRDKRLSASGSLNLYRL